MGLDTTHDAWHGSYSAFTRWRQAIAEAAGYAVWDVKTDEGPAWPTIMLDWGHVTQDNLFGEWEEIPHDPLIILFAHSDCEGCIHPQHAVPLADALELLLPKLEGRDGGGHVGNVADKTKTFIDGLRASAAANETLDFG